MVSRKMRIAMVAAAGAALISGGAAGSAGAAYLAPPASPQTAGGCSVTYRWDDGKGTEWFFISCTKGRFVERIGKLGYCLEESSGRPVVYGSSDMCSYPGPIA